MSINDLKNEIKNVPPHDPVFIYIGVGTAASSQNLSIDQYQQFPPFLQDMRNQFPKLHLFLLLFDPRLESPPQVANDFALHDSSESDTHYQSANGLLQAFVYRQSVYTDSDRCPLENAVNITPTLRDLNEFAKENRVSLVYHDFTGRSTALIANYFDREIPGHLDQLVYGLSAREDHGCFFDLTQANAYFPIRLDQPDLNTRPLVRMFNYYRFIVNNTYADSAAELQKYPEEMHSMALIQKNQIVNNICTQFKTTLLTVLRVTRKLLLDPPSADPIEQQNIQEQGKYMFNALPQRKIFEDLYNEKNYDLLYEIIFNYSVSELDIVVKLKGMDMTGEDILTFITMDEDPYKWYNNINGLR